MRTRFDTELAQGARERAAGVGVRGRREAGKAPVVLLIVLGVVIALTVSAAFAWRSVAGGASVEAAKDLHRVAQDSFDITVIASGELVARRQTEIRSEVEEPAAIVYVVEEGAMVKKGDLLVELASDSIETEIEEDTLRVEEAKSALIAAENDYDIQVSENDAALRQAQLKLELAEIELEKWEKGDLIKRREELDLAIDKAKRNRERWEDKYNQSKQLYEREFLSYDEFKQDEIQLLQAKADLTTAERDKWVFETFEMDQKFKQLRSDVEEAEAEVERVKQQNASRLAQREASLANARRTLGIREERLEREQKNLVATKMSAPTDGLVVYATSTQERRGMVMMGSGEQIQIGTNIRPNETIIVLPDTSEMVAAVRVHESLAGKIQRGQTATVRIDAMPSRAFTGHVIEKSILAESGGWRDPNLREYTVRILLDAKNTDMELKPAMRAEAEIQIGRAQEVLATPVQAVFHDGRIAYVYRDVGGGRFARTPVKVGQRSSTKFEIIDGLSPGDLVLLRQPNPAEVAVSEFDPDVIARMYPEDEIRAEEASAQSGFAFGPQSGQQLIAGVNRGGERGAGQRTGGGGFDMSAMINRSLASLEAQDPEAAKEAREILALEDEQEKSTKLRAFMVKHSDLLRSMFQNRAGGGGSSAPERQRSERSSSGESAAATPGD